MQSKLRQSPALREAVIVFAGFTALTLLLTLPLALRSRDHLPGDLGDPLLNTWILAWDADRLLHGLQGLWDAPIFYPATHTLAYSEHLLGVAVLVAPVQWLTGNPVFSYNVAIVLGFAIAGSGMYLLVRSLLGRRDVAVLAGLIYAFNPYRSLQITLVQVLMSGWMPIALWALHRYFATGAFRYCLALAVAFVVQGLSNGYFLFFQIIPIGIAGLVELWYRRPPIRRFILHTLVAAAIVAAALVPVALAYAQVGLTEPRTGPRTGVDLSSYFKVASINPAWHWWPKPASADGHPIDEVMLFPGLFALALAAVATVLPAPVREWRRVFGIYAAIALVAVVVSMGPEPTAWGVRLPIGGFFLLVSKTVPGFSVLRVPARLATVVLIGLAVVAAIGAARLLSSSPERCRPAILALLLLLVTVEGVPYMWFGKFEPDRSPQERTAYAWLRQSPPGIVVELPMRGAMGGMERDLTREYTYNTLLHGHPIINGHSRFSSDLNRFLIGPGSPLLEPAQSTEVARMFRAFGVRYIVLREWAYTRGGLGQAASEALSNNREDIVEHRNFGTLDAFVLATQPASPAIETRQLRPISDAILKRHASHGESELPLAFDNDPDTIWTTGRRQTGEETIEVEFDHPRSVARVQWVSRLPAWWDFPRRLRIESVDGAGNATVLFHDSILPQLIRGIEQGTLQATIAIDLGPNQSARLRLIQTSSSRRPWSIGELSVWER